MLFVAVLGTGGVADPCCSLFLWLEVLGFNAITGITSCAMVLFAGPEKHSGTLGEEIDAGNKFNWIQSVESIGAVSAVT